MFGPDHELGACPGCTSLADGLDERTPKPGSEEPRAWRKEEYPD